MNSVGMVSKLGGIDKIEESLPLNKDFDIIGMGAKDAHGQVINPTINTVGYWRVKNWCPLTSRYR